MFFENKLSIEQVFREDLEMRIEILLDIVPVGMETFINKDFLTPEWMQSLYENSLKGNCNLHKIEIFNDYGFTDKADAIEKFILLKEAWKDVIEIDISYKGDVEIKFKMALG
ncbi:MAG: hypothetical protein WCG25_01350 [bacterium]